MNCLGFQTENCTGRDPRFFPAEKCIVPSLPSSFGMGPPTTMNILHPVRRQIPSITGPRRSRRLSRAFWRSSGRFDGPSFIKRSQRSFSSRASCFARSRYPCFSASGSCPNISLATNPRNEAVCFASAAMEPLARPAAHFAATAGATSSL